MAVPIQRVITLRALIEDVVQGGSCSECGACVVACPYDILQYVGTKPQALHARHRERPQPGLGAQAGIPDIPNFCPISENVGCDVCASVCPKLELDKELVELALHGRTATAEERSGVGLVLEMWAARSRDPRVLRVCQDGGFVTTLLLHALETGRIDGAVVTRLSREEPCKPVPAVVATPEQVLQSAGSWYTYCPNLLALKDAYAMGLERIAVVGTPCQVTPLRKWQTHRLLGDATIDPEEKNLLRQQRHLQEFIGRIALTVGLFCSETFLYDGLMKGLLQRRMGINLEEVEKFNIKGKILVHLRSGQVVEVPLKEAFPYARPECSYCGDFSAEEADIAAGGVGTNGWTIVLVRTPIGKAVWDDLLASDKIEVKSVDEFPKSIQTMFKLAEKQRERQRRAYAGLRDH